jgi:MFS family permease
VIAHVTRNAPPDARPPHEDEDRRSRAKIPRTAWTRLGACVAAAALLQLDGTLITVALPSVARSLHTTSAFTSLLLSAYFAAYALMLLPGGTLVDRFGARRLALLGLCLFAAGATTGALASSTGALLATRVLQGAGAGIVSPAALAGAVSGFPAEGRQRGRRQSAWTAPRRTAHLDTRLARRLVGAGAAGAGSDLFDCPAPPRDHRRRSQRHKPSWV